MRIQSNFTIINKQTKQGTTADGRDWKMTEYVLKEENGSDQELLIPATASSSVEELQIGAEYECTLFVNSHKHVSNDGLERIFVSFRISQAKLINEAEQDSKTEITQDDLSKIADDVPF